MADSIGTQPPNSGKPNSWHLYARVFLAFARNSLVRDMTFRANFIMESLTSIAWALMNVGFYLIVFEHFQSIGSGTGWGRYEFFVFMATTLIINAILQAFFMGNAEEFSELIRTGGLDFALLKPMDTQFLISFRKVSWSSLTNLVVAAFILAYSLSALALRAEPPWTFSVLTAVVYVFYVICGTVILYSLMVCLAATSIWLGRNQSLYDFWFYITNFSRYPMEMYDRSWGKPLWFGFTFLIPILIVVNVPARVLAQPLSPGSQW